MEKKELLNKAIKENRIIPVTVYGDGMEPEYFNGDIVLVDIKYKNPSVGGEFCINGIGTNVVRADCNGKGIQIIMSNKHHNTYTMDYNQFASNVVGSPSILNVFIFALTCSTVIRADALALLASLSSFVRG